MIVCLSVFFVKFSGGFSYLAIWVLIFRLGVGEAYNKYLVERYVFVVVYRVFVNQFSYAKYVFFYVIEKTLKRGLLFLK